MKISDFNGTFHVNIASNIHDFAPGYHDFGEATVEITDGLMEGKDAGGITWTGSLALAPVEDQNDIIVNMTIDPRTGVPNAVVMHYDGELKREPVDHVVGLKVTYVGASVRLRGRLQIGPIAIDVSIRPVE